VSCVVKHFVKNSLTNLLRVSPHPPVLYSPRSLGTTKDGKGKVVEQISRDMRVFVVGGGSEEILEDLSIRTVASRSLRKAKL
jgi:hypothetical protein